MSKDFKYKDFVNKIRFQVGGVCPENFSEDGEKYIKNFVYSMSLKAAETLHNDRTVNKEACEIITQIIAEWTFHKIIDLLIGEIPEAFHYNVINKINFAIYNHLLELNSVDKLNYDNCSDDTLLESVRDVVDEVYKNYLKQLYADKGIDKDTYLWAIKQSHIDDYEETLAEQEVDETESLKDKFVDALDGLRDEFIKNSPEKFSYKDIFKERPFILTLYIVTILLLFIACTGTARSMDILRVNLFGTFFLFLLIAGLCKNAVESTISICSKKTKKIDDEIDYIKCYVNPNSLYQRLGVDVLGFQMGSALVDLCDPDKENVLLPEVALLRKNLTDELGYIIPNIKVKYCETFEPYECAIFIRGVRRETFYINPGDKDIGKTMISHIRKACIKYANDIITKMDVLKLIELVRTENPTLTNDLIPKLISAIDFRRIMVNLIKEEVSIKDIILIFERLCDFARFSKEPEILTARLRAEMAPQITASSSVLENGEGVLYTITLSDKWEKILSDALVKTELGSMFKLDTETVSDLITSLTNTFDNLKEHRKDVVILVVPSIRKTLFDFLSGHFDEIKVMAFNELSGDVRVEKLGEV